MDRDPHQCGSEDPTPWRHVPKVARREILARGPAYAWATAAALAGLGRPGATSAAAPNKGRWLTKAALPFGRAEVGVALVNGRLYVVGGYANGRVDQPFNQEYDPISNTWRDRAPLPRGLNHVAVAGLGGKVFAFDGFIQQNRGAAPDVSEYDVAADRWRALAPLPAKLGAAGVVALAGKLHVIGGRFNTFDYNTDLHDVYDPSTDA